MVKLIFVKLLLVVLVTANLVTSSPQNSDMEFDDLDVNSDINVVWENYKNKFKVHYLDKNQNEDQERENHKERRKRRNKFRERIEQGHFLRHLKKVSINNEKWRKGILKHKCAVYEWAHLNESEFLDLKTGLEIPSMELEIQNNVVNARLDNTESLFEPSNSETSPINSEVDWRLSGVVSPVKNQGDCGACWAFSATGALESQYRIKYNKPYIFSEQYLIDCCEKAHGCSGGNPYNVFNWFLMGNQITLNESYPEYSGINDTCRYVNSMVVADPKPNGVHYPVKLNNNETALKEVVKNFGPVSVAVSVNLAFSMYKSGIFNDTSCTGANLNHAVLCVGYGTAEDGTDYWIVKNSWGPEWGEDGYIRIIRNSPYNCGIAFYGGHPPNI